MILKVAVLHEMVLASLVPVIWVMVVVGLQPLEKCGMLLYLASLINSELSSRAAFTALVQGY